MPICHLYMHNHTHSPISTAYTAYTSRTRLAAQAVLDGESAADFTWALQCMKEMCDGLEPQSIFTDADLAAECALNQIFPNSDKYRCFLSLFVTHICKLTAYFALQLRTTCAAHACVTHTRDVFLQLPRCLWHLQENITKNLKGALGPDFNSLMSNFKASAFATSQTAMRAKWERVMEASDCL
jgi:hypothetical protein